MPCDVIVAKPYYYVSQMQILTETLLLLVLLLIHWPFIGLCVSRRDWLLLIHFGVVGVPCGR